MPPTPASANTTTAVDSDGDGIPDAWEEAFGLNPNIASDASEDKDGDGRSNREEYSAGTDPRNGASIFAAQVVKAATPGQWLIRFTALAGKSYTIRYKNSLADATWIKLSDVPAPLTTGVVSVLDANLSQVTQRFYEVVTPQQ